MKQHTKAIVLVSGGLDSATCLASAVEELGAKNVTAIVIMYGQKHSKELLSAQKIAHYYNVDIKLIDISTVMQFSSCDLLSWNNFKKGETNDLKDTCVPYRNGLFLSAACSIALSIYPKDKVGIYYGACAADKMYPDCSGEFINCIRKAIQFGTSNKVTVITPLYTLDKQLVILRAMQLGVPMELTWTCYEGRDKACGKCTACIDRLKAFKDLGIEDPIEYEGDVK